MINARGRVSLTSESNKVLLQWNGPYEVLVVVNMMNYKINVKGVVNTYPANMLKLYVERQNVTSYRSAAIDLHSNVKSKDRRDPTVHRVIVDMVTSNNVTCGDVTHGDVTSVKDSHVTSVGQWTRWGIKSRGNGSCKICHAKQG